MIKFLKPTSALTLCMISYICSGVGPVMPPPVGPGDACESFGCVAVGGFLDPELDWNVVSPDPLNPLIPPIPVQTQMWLEYSLSVIIEFEDIDDGICECQSAPLPEVCIEELPCDAVARLTVVFSTLCVQTPVGEAKSTACDATEKFGTIRLNHCAPPPPFTLIQIRRKAYVKCNKCADETC